MVVPIEIYINVGTDASPEYVLLSDQDGTYKKLWLCGAGSTKSSRVVPEIPGSGSTIVPELWVADDPYANGQKVNNYDGTVNTNQYILKIVVGSCIACVLAVYDDNTHGSATADMLIGTTTSSNTSLFKAIDTTSGAPGAGWTSVTDSTTQLRDGNELTLTPNTTNYLNFVVYLVNELDTVNDDVVLTMKITT
ncbi:MAG: hypothetical protein ACTSQY_01030 [Candidatus Odinarchaeia archaeon]